ncbi:MAG: response regulator [Saprospiraceae bacterium]|nr:response regulator [Saprospiraceae bacterium]
MGNSLHISPLENSLNYTTQLKFPYGRASFAIGFAVLDYAHSGEHFYRYVLEGLDKDWQYQKGIPYATYTIQKEGNYLFRVRGSNIPANASLGERVIKITVTPPFYRSFWAKCIYVLLGLVLTYLAMYFVRLRRSVFLEKLSKQQQEELHEARLRLYTDIAHEFRSPLTLILSPLDRLINTHRGFKSTSKQLRSIKSNALKLLDLVDQLITFRKAETDHLELKVEETEFVDFAKKIFNQFQIRAEMQNIDFVFYAQVPSLMLWIDRDKMEKVISNLLSNAFKFTTSGDQIYLGIKEENASVTLTVSDTGVGISEAIKDKIFERHVHLSHGKGPDISSGIGLALSKRMIDLHQGSIHFADAENGGSNLIVTIPKGAQHFSRSVLRQETVESNSIEMQIDANGKLPVVGSKSNNDINEHAPRLLIIEDNWELLQYLREIFSNDYRVLVSNSAQAGIEIARREVPDLIISDVLMDEVSGMELCSILKDDPETSHIPVILLTALSAKEALLEGLKAGADDYLIKPFDPDELLLRVSNLLEGRARIRVRLTRALKMEPESVKYSSIDESFLEKALLTIEANMDNSSFTANEFAKLMMVSRQLLFSKIKSLTSMTPNNLVKSVRMKRAHQILQQNSHTVAEVSKMVGFKDVRYFSRCFEKEYSVTPSQVHRLTSDK